MVQELNSQFPSVPESIATAKRNEIDNAQMEIIDGTLPHDLQGYVFMVAPAGTIDSQGLPFQDGNTFLNGDGMIYRLDLTQPGQVTLKTRLVKPPDYIVDQETQNNDLAKFRNHGIARFSYLLGSRNMLNTAFLPMKFSGEIGERLLVTYDAGRPYEINTETLSLVTPVGQKQEWRSAIPLPYLFSPILTTAHPAFDPYTQQMFTVNYGRSLRDFFKTEEGQTYQRILKQEILKERKKLELQENKQKSSLSRVFFLEFLLEKLIPLTNSDFVDLIRWDGTGRLKKWKLIDIERSPIKIKQSMHQIGVTEDYVVLLDTSFTVGLEQILNLPLPENKELEAKLRELLTLKPLPDSTFYIVRRDDLKEENHSVVAQKIEIPREACHFLVDYKNPNRQITLHVAHISAWHVGEWLRDFDKSPYNGELLPKYIHGMQQSAMDISQMGRYVIDLSEQEPTIVAQTVISDDTYTWGAGLFAYFDRLPSSGMTPERLDNIYWISYGLWKDLTTDFMYQLYEEYKYREKPREEILKLAEKGIPATLFRLDTSSTASMAIADSYQFPPGHIVLSPQFIPRSDGEESSTNGYILCTVFTPEGDQIWIFDAGDLEHKKPCKLKYPELNFGLSLHTTWLQNLKNINLQQSQYKISLRDDYRESVQNLSNFIEDNNFPVTDNEKDELQKKIEDLFENEIYSRFE